MSTPLYTVEMLRLATQIADYPPLAAPDASAEHRSSLCGSRVCVDLSFDPAGLVTACGLSVHACALGQASAALLARSIGGRDAGAIEAARDRIAAFLAGEAEDAGRWPGIGLLAAGRDYPARHAAIRLPFEVAAAAAARVIKRR